MDDVSAHVVGSRADIRWVVEKAEETGRLPALRGQRLALHDDLSHAIQATAAHGEPTTSALKVTLRSEFLLEAIVAGTILRTWRAGKPGWDIVDMPYNVQNCHLQECQLGPAVVGAALQAVNGADPTEPGELDPAAPRGSPPPKRAKLSG
jgi:hypothetical protein